MLTNLVSKQFTDVTVIGDHSILNFPRRSTGSPTSLPPHPHPPVSPQFSPPSPARSSCSVTKSWSTLTRQPNTTPQCASAYALLSTVVGLGCKVAIEFWKSILGVSKRRRFVVRADSYSDDENERQRSIGQKIRSRLRWECFSLAPSSFLLLVPLSSRTSAILAYKKRGLSAHNLKARTEWRTCFAKM